MDAAFSTAIVLRVSAKNAELLQRVCVGVDAGVAMNLLVGQGIALHIAADIAVDLPVGDGIALRNGASYHISLPRYDAPAGFTERLSA